MKRIVNYLVFSLLIAVAATSHASESYLYKPTGQYNVGFHDFHWLNDNKCPDLAFTGSNKNDFSPENTKYCREIMVRIYYPTSLVNPSGTPYYPPLVKDNIDFLKQHTKLSKDEIKQLTNIKSHTLKDAKIVKDRLFPVLLFSPGSGAQVQLYEGIIADVVSHGYIVVGINSSFLSGSTALPNGHIIPQSFIDHAAKEFGIKKAIAKGLALQASDITYVYKKINTMHLSNALFSAMDLKHMGIFGHSAGAGAVVSVVQRYPEWFQAASAFDVASYSVDSETISAFSIPFMMQISSYWQSYLGHKLAFSLGKNGYLVILSPDINEHSYSYHLNFTDYATLQYLPIFHKNLKAIFANMNSVFSVNLMTHEPSKNNIAHFNKENYVFVKKNNKWRGYFYYSGEKYTNIDIKGFPGLEKSLGQLPLKPINELSTHEINSLYKTIRNARSLAIGDGDGWEITQSINTYLIAFFDHFLKDVSNPLLEKCHPLAKNTLIKCGPGVF